MSLPEALTERVQILGSLVGRVQALADGLARRSGVMGRFGLVAAPVAWLTLFGRWAFDSVPRFAFFLMVLAVLAIPGVVLIGFGRLLGGTVDRSETALEDLRALAVSGGTELTSGLAGIASTPGLKSLGSLLGSLWRLREFRSEFGSIVGAVAGSTRLLNPLFLLWVGAAALAAGLVMLLAVVGLVLLVL